MTNPQNVPIQTSFTKNSTGSLFGNIFRRNFGLSMLFTVLCVVAYPLMLFMEGYDHPYEMVFSSAGYILIAVLMVIYALVLSSQLFGYMHNRAATDGFHSLPVKRRHLFMANYLAGVLLITIPVAISTGIALIPTMLYSGSAEPMLTLGHHLVKMIFFLLSVIEFYTMCILFHVFCGTGFGASFYNLLMNVGYMLSIVFISSSLSGFLPGYTTDGLIDQALLSPLSYIFTSWSYTAGFSAITTPLVHLALLAVIFAAALLLYCRRKSEAAGSAFAYTLPKHVLQFIVTLFGALFFAWIFGNMGDYTEALKPNEAVFRLFLGAFIGSILAHISIELIFSKGFGTLLKSLPAYGVFALIFVATYMSVATGFFGFDTWVPKADEVKSVSVSSYYTGYQGDDYYNDYQEIKVWQIADDYFSYEANTFLGEVYDTAWNLGYVTVRLYTAENIERVTELHQKGVEHYSTMNYYYPGFYYDYKLLSTENRREVDLVYEMKNGSLRRRTIFVEESKEISEIHKKIYQSAETQLTNLYLKAQPVSITRVNYTIYTTAALTAQDSWKRAMPPGQKELIIDALTADLEKMDQVPVIDAESDDFLLYISVEEIERGRDVDEYGLYGSTHCFQITPADFPETYACLKGMQQLVPGKAAG